ncbi:MAG TPA: hypothetical protein GXZ22_10125 [Clostridiaceae bacterium]|nr:hypothetical protein [Clostridiaceae bacterium]
MKKKVIATLSLTVLFLLMFATISNANSSWHWVTVSPLKVLPFAVFFTLLIETVAVVFIGKVADIKKSFIVVALANIFSFLAPGIFRAYRFIPTSGGFSLMAAFNKGPYYIVLTGYLVLTLIVELPVVYFLLRKEAKRKWGFIISIVASNIVTTLLVAICERQICIGRW